jgi:cytochrome b subunit of formate dehydrogenase
MNLGLTFKDKNVPLNFYYYILLTDKNNISPIYSLVQKFNNNNPSVEINDCFVQHWNKLFGKETFSNNTKFNLSKNTRYIIITIIVFLVIILGICGIYFFNKYSNNIKLPNKKYISINPDISSVF